MGRWGNQGEEHENSTEEGWGAVDIRGHTVGGEAGAARGGP